MISIDGIDIKDMTLSSLRGQIGVVQQDVFLFSGTLRENIAYGRLDASEEEIWQAVRQAHLEDLVNGYPDGLNTVIGERGVKLSGGQKAAAFHRQNVFEKSVDLNFRRGYISPRYRNGSRHSKISARAV